MHAGWISALAGWFGREWMILVYPAISFLLVRSAARERKLATLDWQARDWPAVDGRASCRVVPVGLGRSQLRVKSVVASDHPHGQLWRTFTVPGEARYCAKVLEGQTVAVHVDPWNRMAGALRWDELEQVAGGRYVSPTQGRLTAGGFRWMQMFRAAAWAGLGLGVAEAAVFAFKPDWQWRGYCVCEVSIGLLVAGLAMLLPAKMLNMRMRALPDFAGDRRETMVTWALPSLSDERPMAAGAFAIMVWLAAGAGVAVGVAMMVGVMVKGDAPDWLWWMALTAPVFPLMWWAMGTAEAAMRRLRPLAVQADAVSADGQGRMVRVERGELTI